MNPLQSFAGEGTTIGEIPIYISREKQTVAERTVPLFSRDAIADISELARRQARLKTAHPNYLAALNHLN